VEECRRRGEQPLHMLFPARVTSPGVTSLKKNA
jgi:hypothetical protein